MKIIIISTLLITFTSCGYDPKEDIENLCDCYTESYSHLTRQHILNHTNDPEGGKVESKKAEEQINKCRELHSQIFHKLVDHSMDTTKFLLQTESCFYEARQKHLEGINEK